MPSLFFTIVNYKKPIDFFVSRAYNKYIINRTYQNRKEIIS